MQPQGDDVLAEASDQFVATPHIQALADRALAYLEVGYAVHFAGAAGTGKTTLAFHVASKLGRPVTLIHGDDEFGSSDLVGKDAGYRKSKADRQLHPFRVEDRREHEHPVGGQPPHHGLRQREYPDLRRVQPLPPRSQQRPAERVGGENPESPQPAAQSGEGYLEVHPDFRAIFTSNPEEYAGVHKTQDALMDRLITHQTWATSTARRRSRSRWPSRVWPARMPRSSWTSCASLRGHRRQQPPADHSRHHRHCQDSGSSPGARRTGRSGIPVGLPRRSHHRNGQSHVRRAIVDAAQDRREHGSSLRRRPQAAPQRPAARARQTTGRSDGMAIPTKGLNQHPHSFRPGGSGLACRTEATCRSPAWRWSGRGATWSARAPASGSR